MKLNNDFILHNDGNKTFLIPTGNAKFSGVVRGNKTFNDVVELLKNDSTEEKIIQTMREKYDAPEGIIERDVKKILANLHEIGAIID